MKQITLNQKRQYIIPFSWEELRVDDRLLYKWNLYELRNIWDTYVEYRIDNPPMFWDHFKFIYLYHKDCEITWFRRHQKISLSEVQIDRTPNPLTQLYHSIIDIWK